jgi:prolipoprotein diacylglyceryltransferase
VAGRVGTLAAVPPAVIVFDFDPYLHIAEGAVRWETLGVAAAIFAAIVLAALGARRLGLRADDLLFVVLGIVPGAVIGGRIGYVFLHPDFFGSTPGAIFDPGVGSLELGLAVVGGAMSGGIVAALIGGSVGAWFTIGALPVLVVIGAGKLAMVLGGTGQGQPWDGSFATAYLGPGPWGSLAPALPSHPSQAYEGIATFLVLALVAAAMAIPAMRRADGRAFFLAVGLWAVARSIIVTTWRDPVTAGPFRTEQVLALLIAIACLAGFVGLIRRGGPSSAQATAG